jgi:hypothetical protein
MDSINFNTMREEVSAWIDKINLKSIPVNIEETERLKEYEDLLKSENMKKKGVKKVKE